MATQLLTVKQVAEVTGLAVGTITAYRNRGQMPEPDAVYGRTPVWRESTIRKWRNKIEKRRASQHVA